MADQSAIEWTDATWNPVTGCDRVSPGCAHCYALDLAARLKRMGNPRYQVDGDPKSSGPGFGVTLHEDVLEKPLSWQRPRRVFVNSMSDLFHEEIPDRFIFNTFRIMREAKQHTFQVLTKRPERMQALLSEWASREVAMAPGLPWWKPPPNVWLGVSIENRQFVNRADFLRQTPAAVRFISAEPLLGPLVHPVMRYTNGLGHSVEEGVVESWRPLDLGGIDWLIVGGESGPEHRRLDPDWVRDLRNACTQPREVGQPETRFFFKQWGGPRSKSGGRELDGRTWDEYPEVAA